MNTSNQKPLTGIRVVEIAGGVAAAYCGRLLHDVGASVTLIRGCENGPCNETRADIETERLYAAYLAAGKTASDIPLDRGQVLELCNAADLVLIGEDATFDRSGLKPNYAVIELSWFGELGPYAKWKGNDLVIQALTGMPHIAGEIDGPPIHAGDRQSALVGGVTAYIASVSGIIARRGPNARHLSINILEANMVLSEMDIHFVERDGLPLKRHGINRFSPNGPVGIYPCKEGWVGITATTPDQWLSLCTLLGMHEQKSDASLATREMRFERLDEVEAAMVKALAIRTPEQWSELGRRHRVPIVPVPNAAGILRHPIFENRDSLASFEASGRDYLVPRTPFGLTKTPTAKRLGEHAPWASQSTPPAQDNADSPSNPPLAGLTIVDFSMGWAGPLASRLLGDLGASVLKIEAGRYPDWWRGVNWTPEYIAGRQYENAKGFCALNRGKRGVSLDLTTPIGKDLALSLIAKADAVVENQAAGVMAKLGLGYEEITSVNPDVVLLSMSAFGTGNPWSETRAYGSTLDQGSGLPSFIGFPGMPPTMAHLAYGDPVGGLFGCAAVLTALVHKKRTGEGQYVNLSMVEAMLQFTTPALIEYQVTGSEPARLGNRHVAMSPHDIYPSFGEDRWLAIAVEDVGAFNRLAQIIGRPEWIGRNEFASVEGRRRLTGEIDTAIKIWSMLMSPEAAARQLQAAGVAAAPIVHTEDIVADQHFEDTGFFIDLDREFSGRQRQSGFAIMQDGGRLGSHIPAPLLGEHSWEVLQCYAGLPRERFDEFVRDDIITFEPKSLRQVSQTPQNREKTVV